MSVRKSSVRQGEVPGNKVERRVDSAVVAPRNSCRFRGVQTGRYCLHLNGSFWWGIRQYAEAVRGPCVEKSKCRPQTGGQTWRLDLLFDIAVSCPRIRCLYNARQKRWRWVLDDSAHLMSPSWTSQLESLAVCSLGFVIYVNIVFMVCWVNIVFTCSKLLVFNFRNNWWIKICSVDVAGARFYTGRP
jgi:hypothetical protein